RHQPRLTSYICGDHAAHGDRVDLAHNRTARTLAVAIHERQHFHLVLKPTFVLTLTTAATDVKLIRFNGPSLQSKRVQKPFRHGFAQTMSEKPRGLERNAKRPVKLICRDTLLAGRHQMCRLKP